LFVCLFVGMYVSRSYKYVNQSSIQVCTSVDHTTIYVSRPDNYTST